MRHGEENSQNLTFYRTPQDAMEAAPETLAYVALLKPDGMAVVDVDPASDKYGSVVGEWHAEHGDQDEFHHFGWNVCSSILGGQHAHHHNAERRYLVVPGIRSSRIYILDTGEDPRQPRLHKTVEPEDIMTVAGYSRPHTVHCGPDGLYVSALGAGTPDGEGGPAGIFNMDHDSFEVLGRWEEDHGSQFYAYDFWWHMDANVLMASEWAPPRLVENGLDVSALVNREYGHKLHFFDLDTRRQIQEIDLGDQHQMALEVRPAHDPAATYGFLGVVIDVTSLASSIWTWYREGDQWKAKKVIEIGAITAPVDDVPEIVKPFGGSVPPLLSDIVLSLDDHYLYAALWGIGEIHQYDVSDPFHPILASRIELGGMARHTPMTNGRPFGGGPQMLELSRDGKRLYGTNSLYTSWDDQFYPEGIPGVMFKIDITAEGMRMDPTFHVEFPGHRAHQIRLQGGDCSTDSYCFRA
ncbi:MAG: selenium-binding protein [Sulfobacillus benefaciens]|uniref:Selenium-binding protein n=1 Tax=Sulfobacillus benefaciens TaxID=453960 RepID=A0A2T2XF48_9FIRM|nr:MAG: selenium-binding protein [Sulfobacillus benefaciens]